MPLAAEYSSRRGYTGAQNAQDPGGPPRQSPNAAPASRRGANDFLAKLGRKPAVRRCVEPDGPAGSAVSVGGWPALPSEAMAL